MGAQITLTLPDDVLRRAEALARRTGRSVGDVLAEAVELSLRPLGLAPDGEEPMTAWTNRDVLAGADGL